MNFWKWVDENGFNKAVKQAEQVKKLEEENKVMREALNKIFDYNAKGIEFDIVEDALDQIS